MRVLVVGLLAAALSGCETKLPSEMSYTEIKQLAQKIYQRCVDQGVAPNTPEMDACLNQEKHRELNMRYDNRETLREIGSGLQKAADNYNRSARQSRPVTCNSLATGPTTTRTTCF